MINNKENNLKLLRLKQIYGLLDSVIKTKKTERLNSAVNSSNKIKIPSYKKIQVKKLNVIDKNKNNENLNIDNYMLDIIKRKAIKRKILMKGNLKTNEFNSNELNANFRGKKTEKVYTERIHNNKIKANRYSVLPKDNKYKNIERSIIEYRIKKNRQKQRNIKDEIKSNSSIYKTAKNINFPNIYNHNSERKIPAYLNISNNQKSKKNFNIKRYYCILNNLRIKLHGNIFITRKSKELKPINHHKNKIGMKDVNSKENYSLSMDKNYKLSNINKYDQICNFSNQIIRESLSEKNIEKVYKNLNQ